MNVIEAINLTKIYKPFWKGGEVKALSDFSIEVPKGTIFGLLGPNGAGKTTFIKILLGIAFPTSGSAKILNEDISNYKIKNKIGYLPENHKYPNYLTGEQVLKFFAELSGYENENLSQKIDEMLDVVKMKRWKKTKVKNYSKGMMQRLGLAQALLYDPELIFLDEPTDGVDPIGRKEMRDVLSNLKNEGKTIFLNSHILSEVEMITDSVAILNKGKLLKTGTVAELTINQQICDFEIETGLNSEQKSILNEHFKIEYFNDKKFSASISGIDEANKIIDFIRAQSILIKTISPQKNTLEDYFISVIQENEDSLNDNEGTKILGGEK